MNNSFKQHKPNNAKTLADSITAIDTSFVSTLASSTTGSLLLQLLNKLHLKNRSPVAVDDTVTTDTSTAISIDVLANDTDPNPIDQHRLKITSVTDGANGTVRLDPNTGELIYTPDPGFVGQDTFTYTIKDKSGARDTATVTVNVGNNNQSPVAADNSYVVDEGASVTGNLITDDANGTATGGIDIDPEGDFLIVTAINGEALNFVNGVATVIVFGGTLQISQNGAFTFNQDGDPSSPAGFTYTISDGTSFSTASVGVSVISPNVAPILSSDYAVGNEDTTITINPLQNDYDANRDPLTITSIDGKPIAPGSSVSISHGVISMNADGTLAFTPAANFNGQIQVPYTVTDTPSIAGDDVESTITFFVTPINDQPDAIENEYVLRSGQTLNGNLIGDDANGSAPGGRDSDIDGDSLFITAINGTPLTFENGTSTVAVAGGTLQIRMDGQFVFAQDSEQAVSTSFTYTISDGMSVDTATVLLAAENAPLTSIADTNAVSADVFQWTLAEPSINPTQTIADFHAASTSDSDTTLDLRDLLMDETTASQSDFISIGADSTALASQTDHTPGMHAIVQQGLGVCADLGLPSTAVNTHIINELINRGTPLSDS